MNIEYRFINALLTKKNISSAIKKLKSESLLIPETKAIYEFILKCYKKYKVIPEVTAVEEKFPAFEYREEIEDLNYLIDQVQEKKVEADLSSLLIGAASLLREKGGFSSLRRLKEELPVLLKYENIDQDVDIFGIERLEHYIEKAAITERTEGIPCGLPAIDNLTNGFGKGDLITIAGPTSVGKSFLATFFAKTAWTLGKKVLFISLEMDARQLIDRIDCLGSHVAHYRLRHGRLTQEEFDRYREYLEVVRDKRTSFIISSPIDCTQSVVSAKILEHRPDICFIDYIDLMRDERRGKEWRETANLIRDLKLIARDPKIFIPIIIIAQIERGFDRKTSDLPTLENIASSMRIPRDSDIVIPCHATTEQEEDNELMIGLAKNRDGRKLRKLILNWDLDNGVIEEKKKEVESV